MWTSLRRAILVVALVAVVACGPGNTSSGTSGAAQPAAPAATSGAATAPSGQVGATAGAPPAPATIRYGQVTVTAMFWGLWAAESQGFMQAENVTVEPTVFRVSSDSTRALSSDSMDVAGGTATDSVVLADEQGNADIVAVSGVLNKPTYSLITSPDVKAFTDLKGKTIAVSDLKDGSTILLEQMLQMKGVQPNEYDMIQAGGTPDRYAAVKSGGAAAALLTQPADFKAESEGFNNLGLVSDLIPDYQFTVNAVRRSWAQQNSDALVRFLRAYVAATRWALTPAHREEALALHMAATGLTRAQAEEDYAAIQPDATINVAGIQTILDLRTVLGFLQGPAPPIERLYDTRYWEAATGRRHP